MLDDIWWASAHVLAISSHAALGIAGVLYFLPISPTIPDHDTEFGDRFRYVVKFWLAIVMGLLGAAMNAHYFKRLLALKQPTALDFPREFYHKRQIALLGGGVVLFLSCAGDLALAATHKGAYHKSGSSSFLTIIVLSILACSSCVVAFVADLIKYYSQWRPDMMDALQLEENQEEDQNDELSGNEAHVIPASDPIRL